MARAGIVDERRVGLMVPRQVVGALRAGWWLLLVGLLVGAAAALGVSALQTPLYSTSTRFFVSTTGSESPAEVLQGNQFSTQRAASYAKLITGHDLAERVAQRLQTDLSPGRVRGEITASAVPDTVLIDVTVTDPSAQRAYDIADAIGTEFPALVSQLETAGRSGPSPVTVTVTDRPAVPTTPRSPDTTRNVAVGAFMGLLAGAGVAVALGSLDRSITDAHRLSVLVGAPVIGQVPRDGRLAERLLSTSGRPAHATGTTSPAVEGYRRLRNSLQRLHADRPTTVIMVTSAVASEGKTTTVLSLAHTLAEAGLRVTVLDADLRTPKVAEFLGIGENPGLSGILAGTADLGDVLQGNGDRNVSVIPAGPVPRDPGELLASGTMDALIEKLRTDNDYVLIDTPALLPVADASGVATHADGVLLTVRHGTTRVNQVRKATDVLEQVKAEILGVVLTMVPS